jgi:hypothetical protein
MLASRFLRDSSLLSPFGIISQPKKKAHLYRVGLFAVS